MQHLLLLLIFNTFLSVIFNYIFKSTRIRKKSIKGVDLLQVIVSSLFSISYLSVFIYIINLISKNPLQPSSFFSNEMFVFNFIFLVAIAFTGLGIHFAAKVIGYHMRETGEVVRIVKFLHITLSHLLIYSALICSLVNIAFYEYIHPFRDILQPNEYLLIGILGIIAGYYHGLGFARSRSLSSMYGVFLFFVALIVFQLIQDDYASLPLSLFIAVSAFVMGIVQFTYKFAIIKRKPFVWDISVYNEQNL